jgi:hypothetical protein
MIKDNLLQLSSQIVDLIPSAESVPSGSVKKGLDVADVFGRLEFFGWGGVFGVLGVIWSIYTILAYIISIGLLVLYVYASMRKKLYADLQTQALRDAEKLYDQQYRGAARNSRLEDVLTHSDSDNPNDWKLAIIEADIILDDLLKQHGYAGNSLGERLKSVSPRQLNTLNDAWEAHKIRNRIAHDGADFVLTKRVAQETITQYRRVFAEFGVT